MCVASESRKRMKCQFLRADLKKNMRKLIDRGVLKIETGVGMVLIWFRFSVVLRIRTQEY